MSIVTNIHVQDERVSSIPEDSQATPSSATVASDSGFRDKQNDFTLSSCDNLGQTCIDRDDAMDSYRDEQHTSHVVQKDEPKHTSEEADPKGITHSEAEIKFKLKTDADDDFLNPSDAVPPSSILANSLCAYYSGLSIST